MLLSCAVRLKGQGKEYRTLKLYGQERNLITSSIARMNLFLHGFEDFHIQRGDTLADPKFLEGDHLRRFDVVLANPPYSIKQWNRAAWESDRFGRNFLGVPPQGRADYAFFQHILKSLKPGSGRCAILFPHGVLFRDEEQEMRKKLIEQDLVECVIGLGPNLFYNSPMEACIVICRTHKPPERRDQVLLINAVNEVTRERAQSYLEEEHIEKLVLVYRGFKEVEDFSRVVAQAELMQQNASLNIALYVRNKNGNGKESTVKGNGLAAAISDWQASSMELRKTMAELIENLQKPQ
jgi:type I restriction enzyme M protein